MPVTLVEILSLKSALENSTQQFVLKVANPIKISEPQLLNEKLNNRRTQIEILS